MIRTLTPLYQKACRKRKTISIESNTELKGLVLYDVLNPTWKAELLYFKEKKGYYRKRFENWNSIMVIFLYVVFPSMIVEKKQEPSAKKKTEERE